MNIKVQCTCGQRYAFEVEPIDGQMPYAVHCPNCRAEGTGAANRIIAEKLSGGATSIPVASLSRAAIAPATIPTGAPVESAPPPAASSFSKLRISRSAESAAAPAQAASPQIGADPGTVYCNRHAGKPAQDYCFVCKKPICSECMSMFGYLCSAACRYHAEQTGIKVPGYRYQKMRKEQQDLRKGMWITAGVIVLLLLMFGGWIWYADYGRKPRIVYKFTAAASRDNLHVQFVGPDKALIFDGKQVILHDLKTEKDLWTAYPKDEKKSAPKPNLAAELAANATQGELPVAAAAPATRPTARATARPVKKPVAAPVDENAEQMPSPDLTDDFSFDDFGSSSAASAFVEHDNIWLNLSHSVQCLDLKSGEIKQTISFNGKSPQVTPDEGGLLVVTSLGPQRREITHIDFSNGATKTEDVVVPRAKKQAVGSDELPPFVAPTAGVLLSRALDDQKNYRPVVTLVSSEFFSSGKNLVELRTKLAEIKMESVQTMKPKGKTVIDGNLSASTSHRAVAEEIFNDLKRSETGGFKQIDVSRYEVTVRRWLGENKPNELKLETISAPTFFSVKTVDLVVAAKMLIAVDKQNKKLFEAKLNFPVHESFLSSYSRGAVPAVEGADVLYFFDEGVLTAFELPGGNVRWRLTSVGISRVQFDRDGMLYVNSTTAAPEDIQFTEQIKMEKVSPVILKVDPKNGKILWKLENKGQQCFLADKYLLSTSADMGGLGLANALRDALGQAAAGPTYFHMYRIDPKNGNVIWDFYREDPPNEVDFQGNKILVRTGNNIELLKFWTF